MTHLFPHHPADDSIDGAARSQERSDLDLEALRRYARAELEWARLGSSELATVDADDIVDAVLLDTWTRWGTTDAALPLRLVSELGCHIQAVAQHVGALPFEDVEDDWVGANSPFWPDRDWISFEERVAGEGPDPEAISEFLEGLSLAERRAVLLRRSEGLPIEELAVALGTDRDEAERLLESAAEKLLAADLAY